MHKIIQILLLSMTNTTLYIILGFGLTYSYIKEYHRKKVINEPCLIELENYIKAVKTQKYNQDILLKKYYFCAKSKFE